MGIFRRIWDWLFPINPSLEILESITAAEFRQLAGANVFFQEKNAMALFDYRRPLIRKAIWELKYRGNRQIAKLLAETLYQELLPELADRLEFENFLNPILIPLPISEKRRRERGFNQCELLGEKLVEADDNRNFIYHQDLLLKNRHTESQTRSHNRRERLENLRGCFSVKNPQEILGRNLVLLDDVITTGATVKEARRTLLASGARKVIIFAIAH